MNPERIAVVDLTTEFPERLRSPNYCLLPVWDGTAPTMDHFRIAVAFIKTHRAAGRTIVIHCAFGVGRSTTMLIAAMLYFRICSSIDDGLKMIQRKRPCCRLNAGMRSSLEMWDINNQKVAVILLNTYYAKGFE